jgi:hypothetical protein
MQTILELLGETVGGREKKTAAAISIQQLIP